MTEQQNTIALDLDKTIAKSFNEKDIRRVKRLRLKKIRTDRKNARKEKKKNDKKKE